MHHFQIMCCFCIVIAVKRNPAIALKNVINDELISINNEDGIYKKCIQDLISNYRQPEAEEVVVTNMNYYEIFLNKSVISIDLSSVNAPLYQEETVVYLLDLRNHTSLGHFYYYLGKHYFKPRAKFIFISRMNMAEEAIVFLKALSDYYICKVLIVDEKFNVYTYFPYKYESINSPHTKPVNIGPCFKIMNNLTQLNRKPLYPKLWRNSTIHAYFKQTPLLANENFTGTEQRLLFASVIILKYHLVPYLDKHEFQGIKYENGTYQNRGLDLLHKRQVQMALGGYMADPQFQKDFDNSPIAMTRAKSFFTPKALEKTRWNRIINVINGEAMFAFMGITIVWILFVNVAYGENILNLIRLSFMINWQIPVPELSRYKFRIPLAVWILGFSVVSTTLLTFLERIFFSTTYDPEIHTMEDVLNSNLPILVPPETLESFKQSNQQRDKLLVRKMIACTTDTRTCLKKVCADRKAVLIGPQNSMMELALDICFNRKTGQVLYHLGDDVDMSYFQIYYAKGFPPADTMNDMITKVVLHAGLSSKEEDDGMKHYKRVAGQMRAKRLKSNALDMDLFLIIYLFWLIGLSVAAIVFFVELYCAKSKKKFPQYLK